MTLLETLKSWNIKAGQIYDKYMPIIEGEIGYFNKGLSKVNDKYQDEKKNAPKDKPKPIEVKVVNPCHTGFSRGTMQEPNPYAGKGTNDKLFKRYTRR